MPDLIGVVTGLKVEAALVGAGIGSQRVLCATGLGPGPAAAAARRLVGDGARALASVGLAGGLAPALASGHVVIARHVLRPDGMRLETDAAWRARILTRLADHESVIEGVVQGCDRPVLDTAAKAALHGAGGAHSVDMESHVVAAVADQAGVPFAVIRAIADPAERAVPRIALAGLRADGGVDAAAVIKKAVAAPWLFPALIRVASDSRRGLGALGRVLAILGPGLAFIDEV